MTQHLPAAAARRPHGRLAHALARVRTLLPEPAALPDDVWRRRHSFLLVLLAAHVAVMPGFAAWMGYSPLHALLEGALVPAAFFLAALPAALGRKARSVLVAIGLTTCSALLVHLSGGYIEAHFHFFLTIVVLALYEDWLPFLVALGYVVLHHAVGSVVDPTAIYNHSSGRAHPLVWAAVHGVAVTFFCVLSIGVWRLNAALRAQRERALEDAERRNSELREVDRMKSEFVSIASHELRTPLTSILGFATTLAHRWESIDEPLRLEYVSVIEEQGTRLKRLVEDLLDMSRIESGGEEPRPEPVVLRPALERAAAGFAGARIDLGDADGVQALADPRHVDQVLLNYLANALTHGREPVSVEVRPDGDVVEVRVRDSGEGVPPEFVPHLFDKFTRARGETREGSGLGLAIVRGLARANGGDAWYEADEGGRPCFALRLPRALH